MYVFGGGGGRGRGRVILIHYLALSYLANIIDFSRLLVHPVSMTQVFAINPLSSVYEFEWKLILA